MDRDAIHSHGLRDAEARHPAGGYDPDAGDIAEAAAGTTCPLCGGTFTYWPGDETIYCRQCGSRPAAERIHEAPLRLKQRPLPPDDVLLALADELEGHVYADRRRIPRERFGISAARFWQAVHKARVRRVQSEVD